MKLSIVLLVNNRRVDLKKMINSLNNQTLPHKHYEIIIVDNGANNKFSETLEGPPNIKVLRLTSFQGTAGGFNQAISYASGEIILLLPQPASLNRDFLNELVIMFQSDALIGAVSFGNQTSDFETGYIAVPKINRLGMVTFHKEKYDDKLHPTQILSGEILAIKNKVIRDVGGFLFDEWLGSYLEKLDLSLRMQKTSWKMYVAQRAWGTLYSRKSHIEKARYRIGKYVHLAANRLFVYYYNFPKIQFAKKFFLLLFGIPLGAALNAKTLHMRVSRFIVSTALLPFSLLYLSLRILSRAEIESETNKGTNSKKKKKTRKPYAEIGIICFILISCVLYFIKMEIVDIPIDTKSYLLLFVLLLLAFMYYFVGGLRFYIVFRRFKYFPKFWELFAAAVTSQFSGFITVFGSGQLIISPFLKQMYRIPIGTSAVLLAVDRTCALYMWTIFGIIGIFGLFLNNTGLFVLIAIPILFCSVWIFFALIRSFDDSIHRFGVPEYGGNTLNKISDDILVQLVILFTIFSRFIFIICELLVIAHIMKCPINFLDAWVIMSFSTVAGLLSMMPMGLLGMDATMVSLFYYIDIPISVGVGIVLIYRALSSLSYAVLWAPCGLWFGKKLLSKN